MKKNMLHLAFILMTGSITLIGCTEESSSGPSSDKQSTEQQDSKIKTSIYYCPMKCEGETTYVEKGSCPKCGMDLVKKE